jgi:hypothetical protein
MLKSVLAAATLGLTIPAAPALADHAAPVRVEVQFHSVDHRHGRFDRSGIDRREATRIAASYGMSRIYDLDLKRGVWEVSGSTWRGGHIEIEISARTGRVLDVDYGRGQRGRGRGRGRGW